MYSEIKSKSFFLHHFSFIWKDFEERKNYKTHFFTFYESLMYKVAKGNSNKLIAHFTHRKDNFE